MIIENAFGYLPEILTGSNYGAQDYEAGIVNAVSLAVLQELNARNAPNPLSFLTIEKLYNIKGFTDPNGKPRYLRADLFLDSSRLHVGTEALSRFGWRHKNWLEAKFLRTSKNKDKDKDKDKDKNRPNTPTTTSAALIAADIIRLCTLVLPETNKRDANNPYSYPSTDGKYTDLCTGRYFLHIYDDEPENLVGKTSHREWLKEIRKPGKAKFTLDVSKDKAQKKFKDQISPELLNLKIKASITNFVRDQSPGNNNYLCVLTRIDSFEVTWTSVKTGTTHSWSENPERNGTESKPEDWRKICSAVGNNLLANTRIGPKEELPPSEDEKASISDENPPEQKDNEHLEEDR